MTIITPLTAAGLGTVILRPLPDVQPFSIQSGYSFEGILSDMRTWLRDVLVPYLEDSSAQAIFQQNVDTMVDRVNEALTEQSAIVTAALNAAVNEVIAGAIPVEDGLVLAVLNAVSSTTRDWLQSRFASGVTAAAPRGAGLDDTANLMNTLALVQAFGGTMTLQRGDYLCNLLSAQSFIQPLIVGQGEQATKLHAFDRTKPVVKFRGGSGGANGGGLRDVGLVSAANAANQGDALVFSGTTSVKARNVRIAAADASNPFANGVIFFNELGLDFTEFCTFDGDISGCSTPVVYRVANGVESFHGSGIVGNTTINMPTASTNAVCEIEGIAMPYQAPFEASVFLTPNSHIFHMNDQGRAGGRHPSFYGQLMVEGRNSADYSPAAISDGGNRLLFVGGVNWLSGAAKVVLGAMYLCSKVGYDGGTVWAEYLPISSSAPLKNTPTIVADGKAFEGGSLELVAASVSAPNYEYHALLLVHRSAFDGTQAVAIVELSRTQLLDPNGHGAPQWSFNNALYCANGTFDSSFNADVTVTALGGSQNHRFLTQARNG